MAEVSGTDLRVLEPCRPEVCEKVRVQIARMCLDKGWPPGTPVLIYEPDGKVCTCTCP
jgi:hypothetical protein